MSSFFDMIRNYHIGPPETRKLNRFYCFKSEREDSYGLGRVFAVRKMDKKLHSSCNSSTNILS